MPYNKSKYKRKNIEDENITIKTHNLIFNDFQTLNSISAEKNSTIIFPLPMEILGGFMEEGVRKRKTNVEQ